MIPNPACEVRNTIPLFKKATYVVAFSALLNPLNSSMISVGLLHIASSYSIGISQASWLITGYFLATAVGQPVMGKLADLFGPRRIFLIGLVSTALFSLLTLWAPSFGLLLALRILQAFCNTASFPAGMAILQTMVKEYWINDGKIPSSSMSLISIMNNVTAALGPVLGGYLVTYAGWKSIFWINAPIIAVIFVLYKLLIPSHAGNESQHIEHSVWKLLDLPGMLFFSTTLLSVMFLLMSFSSRPRWWLLIVIPILALTLYAYELRKEQPFFNIVMLKTNLKLLAVYVQYAGSSIAFFCLFFGFPLWLERVKGVTPQTAGLIMLPLLGFGVVATQAAVRLIARFSYRFTIVSGYLFLITGALLLVIVQHSTPLAVILLALSIVGISNGLTNMGLQTALYAHTEPQQTGMVSGLFLTFRSLGSIFSTSLISLVFAVQVNTTGLHIVAIVIFALGLLLAASSRDRHGRKETNIFSSQKSNRS